MPTDSERRKAAAWLRSEIGNGHHWPGALTIAEAIGVPDPTGSGWGGRLLGRLADLMEPPYPDATASYKGWRAEVYDPDVVLASPSNVAADLVRAYADPKMRHSTKEEQNEYSAMLENMSVELHPVDRDALLALADEMDVDAGCHAYVDDHDVYDYARRIREALGVEVR